MVYKLSPSSLNLFKDCPRCFWLHFRKGIKRPSGAFPSLPSGMDRIIKEHFDLYIGKNELPPELEKEGIKAKLFDDMELLKIWRNNRRGLQWKDSEGNVLRGAIDNVLQKGRKLIVLDYKTRGFPLKEDTHEHYKDQLDIYNFLLRKNGYETENYSYLLFYYPNNINKEGNVIFDTKIIKMDVDVKSAEDLFKRAIDTLKGNMPEPSEGCEYCKWVDNYIGVIKQYKLL